MAVDSFTHWRDSAREPKLFILDARAAFPVLVCFLIPTHWWSWIVAFVTITFLYILERLKMPLVVALRVAKGWISGKFKTRGT